MASGDSGGKWPAPVTFNDNSPKQGYAEVILKVPELKVKKEGFFGKTIPKNAKIQQSIEKEKVSIQISIEDGDNYVYDKQMPENINEKQSKLKYKEGRVVLVLCKEKDVSWGSHSSYLIKKQ